MDTTGALIDASPGALTRDVESALRAFHALRERLDAAGERLLHCRVLSLDPEPNLGLEHLLECAGADVSVAGRGLPEWGPRHARFYLALLRQLRHDDREAFDPDPLITLLLSDAFAAAPRRLPDLSCAAPGEFDLVLGCADLSPTRLAELARLTREGGLLLCTQELPVAARAELEAAELLLLESSGGRCALRKDSRVFTEHPSEDDSPQTLAHCLARYAFVAPHAEGKRVLDVGCGAGVGTRALLAASPASVDAVDVNEEALEEARERTPGASFQRVDLETGLRPFGDASFDLVVCMEVLEHVEHQAELIAEIHRVLAPGGLAVVSVPYAPFEDFWADLTGEDNPFHLHVPSIDEFRGMLSAFERLELSAQADVVSSIVLPLDEAGGEAPKERLIVHGPSALSPVERGTITVIGVGRKGPGEIPRANPPVGHAYGDHQASLGSARLHGRDLERRCARLEASAFREQNRGKWERLKSREFLLAPRNALARLSKQGLGDTVGQVLASSRAWLSRRPRGYT